MDGGDPLPSAWAFTRWIHGELGLISDLVFLESSSFRAHILIILPRCKNYYPCLWWSGPLPGGLSLKQLKLTHSPLKTAMWWRVTSPTWMRKRSSCARTAEISPSASSWCISLRRPSSGSSSSPATWPKDTISWSIPTSNFLKRKFSLPSSTFGILNAHYRRSPRRMAPLRPLWVHPSAFCWSWRSILATSTRHFTLPSSCLVQWPWSVVSLPFFLFLARFFLPACLR